MFIEDKELHDIKSLLKGKKKPDAILLGLKKYFAEQFDCEIYAYICDKVTDGRLRLRFIVWDNATRQKFFKSTEKFFGVDDKKINAIKAEFSTLCIVNNCYKDYWEPKRYFAVPSEIESDLLEEVQNIVHPQISNYLNGIKSVKEIAFWFGTVHIFYETDADIELNRNNGLSDKIRNVIFQIKKAADEFGVCENGGVVFSSIQTLNEKFGGSMQHYFH